jgi:hypothetical protein
LQRPARTASRATDVIGIVAVRSLAMADDNHSVDNISGNAPEDAKAAIQNMHHGSGESFGHDVIRQLKLVSVDINRLPMGNKKEVVVVFELVVQESQSLSISLAHLLILATE